jgi:hypothetical protein
MAAMQLLFSFESSWCGKIPNDTFHLAAHYIRRLSINNPFHQVDVPYLLNIANKFLHDEPLNLPQFSTRSVQDNRMFEGALLEKLGWSLNHHTRYDMVCEHLSLIELPEYTSFLLRDSEHQELSDERAANNVCEYTESQFSSPPPIVNLDLTKRKRVDD